MRGFITVAVALIAWLGTLVICIYQWHRMWEAGDGFWVFITFFTGIGWVPVLIIGVINLFSSIPILMIIYIMSVVWYFKLFADG